MEGGGGGGAKGAHGGRDSNIWREWIVERRLGRRNEAASAAWSDCSLL